MSLKDKEISKFTIDDLNIGDSSSFEEQITKEMVDGFAEVSGDFSTLHINGDFAKELGFNGRVVHGVLMTGLFSRLVGMQFPGENAILQSMNTVFLKPSYIGDNVIVKATVDHISAATKTIVLKGVITNIATQEVLVRTKIQVGFTNEGKGNKVHG
jgi:3-hydroxybutyryl-CoA dehydratase